jgi:hypothetical protein
MRHIYTHANVYVCVFMNFVFIPILMSGACVCITTCMYIHACIWIPTYIHIYIYTHKNTCTYWVYNLITGLYTRILWLPYIYIYIYIYMAIKYQNPMNSTVYSRDMQISTYMLHNNEIHVCACVCMYVAWPWKWAYTKRWWFVHFNFKEYFILDSSSSSVCTQRVHLYTHREHLVCFK